MSIDSESGLRLPEVGGDHLNDTLVNFVRRSKVYIAREQEKISPDNGLIAVLCDAVRLAREHNKAMSGRTIP